MTQLAEDGLPEDRVRCRSCRNCVPERSYCRAFAFAVIVDLPLRCLKFTPLPSLPDQRNGLERWPELVPKPPPPAGK